MRLISTAISVIGGASSLYSILITIGIGGYVMYHYYDKYVTTPISIEKEKRKMCEKTLKSATTVYEAGLREAGTSISSALQKASDTNYTLMKLRETKAIELQECRTKLKSIKWGCKLGKNKNDKYFYTHYPIK